MELLIIILVALLFIASLFALFSRSKFPQLPGPRMREYLPNGEVFPMLADSRTLLRTVMSMHRKYGDTFNMWLGPTKIVVTAVPADIAQILGTSDTFARPRAMHFMLDTVLPGSLFTMPKKLHLAARRHFREKFNYSMLQGFHVLMNEAVEELFQNLTNVAQKASTGERSEIVNITQMLSVTTFRVITNVAFGYNLDREERLKFSESTTKFIDEMLLDFVGYPFRQALTIFGVRKRLFENKKTMDEFCRRFIRRRLEETKEQKEARAADVLDAIATLPDQDMTDITSQTLLFAVAGSHTTNEVLAWCLYETCCSPHVVAKIHKELADVFSNRVNGPVVHDDIEKLSYLKCVWKEALRLHPPGGFITRTATKDVSLAGSGLEISKGTMLAVLPQAGHTNPSIWSHPDKFMPERWGPDMGEGGRAPPGSYVPFSIGARSCAGQFFADHEAVLILAELHRRFEFNLACAPEEVVSCTGWLECARSCVGGGDFSSGVPVYITVRDGIVT